jgi:hypothetical protein
VGTSQALTASKQIDGARRVTSPRLEASMVVTRRALLRWTAVGFSVALVPPVLVHGQSGSVSLTKEQVRSFPE